MKHFVLFVTVVFIGLSLALLNRTNQGGDLAAVPILRVFGYSTFTGRWGPGPLLKASFEKNCKCKVEFIEGSDSGILLQRLRIEGESLGADLVIGLDQFDLSKAMSEQKWRNLSLGKLDTYEAVRPAFSGAYFVPYDWGQLSFIARKEGSSHFPSKLDELLLPEYRKKLALQDPRTSSTGKQFLFWVLDAKGEVQGFKYIEALMEQAHSFSPSWSTAYGLFTSKQAAMTFSYVTTPLYQEIEEKKKEYLSLKFEEAMPVQIEFMGIPDFCRNCELASQFVNFLLSSEGQKIIMEKNYMFPVVKGILEKSPFAAILPAKNLQKFKVPPTSEVERVLKRWTDIRRNTLN